MASTIDVSGWIIGGIDGQASVVEAAEKLAADPTNAQLIAGYNAAYQNAVAAETALVPVLGAITASAALDADIKDFAANGATASSVSAAAANAATLLAQGVGITAAALTLPETALAFTVADIAGMIGNAATVNGAIADKTTIENWAANAAAEALNTLGLTPSTSGTYTTPSNAVAGEAVSQNSSWGMMYGLFGTTLPESDSNGNISGNNLNIDAAGNISSISVQGNNNNFLLENGASVSFSGANDSFVCGSSVVSLSGDGTVSCNNGTITESGNLQTSSATPDQDVKELADGSDSTISPMQYVGAVGGFVGTTTIVPDNPAPQDPGSVPGGEPGGDPGGGTGGGTGGDSGGDPGDPGDPGEGENSFAVIAKIAAKSGSVAESRAPTKAAPATVVSRGKSDASWSRDEGYFAPTHKNAVGDAQISAKAADFRSLNDTLGRSQRDVGAAVDPMRSAAALVQTLGSFGAHAMIGSPHSQASFERPSSFASYAH